MALIVIVHHFCILLCHLFCMLRAESGKDGNMVRLSVVSNEEISVWWNCLHSCGQWYKEIPCYEKFPIVSLRALLELHNLLMVLFVI